MRRSFEYTQKILQYQEYAMRRYLEYTDLKSTPFSRIRPCGALLSREKLNKYPIFQNMVVRRSFEYNKAFKLSLGKQGNAALFRVNEEGYE